MLTANDVLHSPAAQMLLGAVLSALVSIILEWQKRPKICIRIETPRAKTGKIEDALGQTVERYRSVRVLVRNTKRWPGFWPRQTLARATAQISFHDVESGANHFRKQMWGRWASLPQPETIVPIDGKRMLLPDPSLVTIRPEIDIPWGEEEPLDIAARFEDDSDAYGWSNENYYDQTQRYRAPRWRMPWEQCQVRVVVRGGGETCRAVFRLENPDSGDLQLLPASSKERKAALI